jgi:uncharacterized membrane protein YqhA
MAMVEKTLEKFLFGSRWLLAPFYVMLVVALAALLLKAGQETVHFMLTDDHKDWPEWMGKIDFTGLKLKLVSSIVAISAIQVLKAFMNVGKVSDRELLWLVGIHMMFVLSGLLMALTDKWTVEAVKPKKAE